MIINDDFEKHIGAAEIVVGGIGALILGAVTKSPIGVLAGAPIGGVLAYQAKSLVAEIPQFYTADGDYELLESKITSEQAHTGSRSYKLSVIVIDGNYLFFERRFLIPIPISRLIGHNLSGYILPMRLNGCQVGMGCSFRWIRNGTPYDQGNSRIAFTGEDTDWVPMQSDDLFRIAQSMTANWPERRIEEAYLNSWYIHLSGVFAGQAITVYVDDVLIN